MNKIERDLRPLTIVNVTGSMWFNCDQIEELVVSSSKFNLEKL